MHYIVTSEESRFESGKYRALVKRDDGAVSYLGSNNYSTEREAITEAANYLSDLLSGNVDVTLSRRY